MLFFFLPHPPASNNVMAKRQGSGGATGWIHWMLAAVLLWSHQTGGQGQGKWRSFTTVFHLLNIAQQRLEKWECKSKCWTCLNSWPQIRIPMLWKIISLCLMGLSRCQNLFSCVLCLECVLKSSIAIHCWLSKCGQVVAYEVIDTEALHYLAVISAMNMQYSERLLLQCYKYFPSHVFFFFSLVVVHNNRWRK